MVVYHLPNATEERLLNLLETVSCWILENLTLLVLEDFSVHTDYVISPQARDLVSSMAALGLSQFVMDPTYQVGHILDLLLGAEIMVDLITTDTVPWLDHFVN